MDMLSMGGYGGYVWTSYALTLIVVLVCWLQSRRRDRRIRNELTTRLLAAERVAKGATNGPTETAGEIS
jgi:heme exporter protein CcmD